MGRKITVYVSMGYVGCKNTEIIDLDEDDESPMSDDEIDELARDVMFSMIDWGWKVAP